VIEVRLTELEMCLAAHVGILRHVRALRAGRRESRGLGENGDPWAKHIHGAAGELAYAKVSGRYWSGAGVSYENDDDVSGVQVRCRAKHTYELYVWPDDPDDALYVLVTGVMPELRVHGTIFGFEAKAYGRFGSHVPGAHPAYFLRHDQLDPLEATV
jgi:hypothetical protein